MITSTLQLVVMVVLLTVAATEDVPLQHDRGICLHGDECGPSHCCLVGFGRYTSPTCSPLGEVGSYCKQNSAQDFNLGYPNGLQLNVKEGYYGFCPCRPGLMCCPKTAMCALAESCFPGLLTNETEDV